MSALIANDYDNVRLTRVIRGIVPSQGLESLASILTDQNKNTRSFKIDLFQRVEQVAPYRGFDAPSPVASRGSLTTKTGKLPPISFSNVISEDETLGIYERVIAGDWDDEIDAAIYDDATELTDAIHNRVERSRGQVLQTGKFTVSENGVEQEADFGRAAGNATTVGTNWATTATATPLQDIRAVVEQSKTERDVHVTRMLLSSQQISYLLFNKEIRDMLAANGTSPAIASIEDVQRLLTAHRLPQIIEYDRSIAGVRVIAQDVAIFLPPNSQRLGETQWGTTAEALKLGLDINERPGITGTVMTKDNPVQTLTNVSALVMPVLKDPDLVYTLDTTP